MHIAFLFRGYTLPDVHASSYTISYICLFGYLLADKVAREMRHDSRKCRKDI